MYTCMYMCMYICMYICMYKYSYLQRSSTNTLAPRWLEALVCASVCKCIHMIIYVYMYICLYGIYIGLYVYVSLYTCMYIVCIYVYICMYVCIHVHIHIYICAYVYIHMYVCIYVYIHIYTARSVWKMRLEMIVELQIEILNSGEILVNCKPKITIWICTGRYREIRIQSKSQFEFVLRDTEKFEFLDFDQLTKISPPFRISICISTIISSLIFHRTGCTCKDVDMCICVYTYVCMYICVYTYVYLQRYSTSTPAPRWLDGARVYMYM